MTKNRFKNLLILSICLFPVFLTSCADYLSRLDSVKQKIASLTLAQQKTTAKRAACEQQEQALREKIDPMVAAKRDNPHFYISEAKKAEIEDDFRKLKECTSELERIFNEDRIKTDDTSQGDGVKGTKSSTQQPAPEQQPTSEAEHS